MYAGGKLWWGSTSVDGAVVRRLWAIGKAGIMMECETTSQGENVKPPAELAPTMPTICFDSPPVSLGVFLMTSTQPLRCYCHMLLCIKSFKSSSLHFILAGHSLPKRRTSCQALPHCAVSMKCKEEDLKGCMLVVSCGGVRHPLMALSREDFGQLATNDLL